MPPVDDLSRVRACLDRDRAWSAYAIGDLHPDLAQDCVWLVAEPDAASLVLLYRGFSPPILFAMGDPAHLAPLVAELDAPLVSLHIRPEALPALAPTYLPSALKHVWRMSLDAAAFRPIDDAATAVEALDESDLDALGRLYDDGHANGEGPTFFQPSMLRQGTFRGIREGTDLIAVAGTHLFSTTLGICTVGNVYTRRDRRRLGHGACVTSAVVRHALDERIPTIVLNVGQENHGARRLYEQLGFVVHCPFLEGEARSLRDSEPRAPNPEPRNKP